MQLGSANLTQKYFTMSSRKPFSFGIKKSRSRVTKTLLAWVFALLWVRAASGWWRSEGSWYRRSRHTQTLASFYTSCRIFTPASSRLCRDISPRCGATGVVAAVGQRYDVIGIYASNALQLDYPFSGVQFLFRFRDKLRLICMLARRIYHRPRTANRSSIICAVASIMSSVSGRVGFYIVHFQSSQPIAHSELVCLSHARLPMSNNLPTNCCEQTRSSRKTRPCICYTGHVTGK